MAPNQRLKILGRESRDIVMLSGLGSKYMVFHLIILKIMLIIPKYLNHVLALHFVYIVSPASKVANIFSAIFRNFFADKATYLRAVF